MIWDLDDKNIGFAIKQAAKCTNPIEKGSEIFISYGARANCFLLIEYGFTIPNNVYDYFRINEVTAEDFFNSPAAKQAVVGS